MAGKTSAQPVITAVSPEATQGELIEITGENFGIKTRAAPLVWDDCTADPPLDTHYDGWLPTAAQQGSQYNMAYRAVSFRGVDGPHGRLSYFLAGAHAIDTNSGTYAAGGNVGIGKNNTSQEYFVSYYYRVDPQFDEENNPNMGENNKMFVLSGEAGEFYVNDFPPGHGYVGWCGSDAPDINSTGPAKFGRIPITPANQELPYGCSGNNLVEHQNPINGWIQLQWEGTYNQTFDSPQIAVTTFPDNKRTHISHYGDPLTVMEYARGNYPGYPKQADLQFIGLGGFARVPRHNSGHNSFRYFAAVYIDDSRARVVLADNASYDQATIVEPQIPTAWEEGAITARVNLGRLADCSATYLFVFDPQGRPGEGYPVTTGGCGGPASDGPASGGDSSGPRPGDSGSSIGREGGARDTLHGDRQGQDKPVDGCGCATRPTDGGGQWLLLLPLLLVAYRTNKGARVLQGRLHPVRHTAGLLQNALRLRGYLLRNHLRYR